MGKTYLLYVDESGTSSPTFHPDFPYVLSSVVIEQSKQKELETQFDELKLKYWGTKDIVLHSEDIGKNINDCRIFRNKSELKNQFIDDLMDTVRKAPAFCFYAIVEKTKLPPTARETTIVKKTAQSVFFNFLAYLLTRPDDSRGKIIIEASSAFKDVEYLKSFTHFLSPGCKLIDADFPPYDIIRKKLTQLSFVTKLNHDTETQIADILSYGAHCKYKQVKGASYSDNSYKGKICAVIDEKMFILPRSASGERKKFYKKIKSFDIIF